MASGTSSPIAVREMLLAMLSSRAVDATVCPSEVAKALASGDNRSVEDDWRAAMPGVHAAVDGLVLEGRIRLSWKGLYLEKRAGPYRIGRNQT